MFYFVFFYYQTNVSDNQKGALDVRKFWMLCISVMLCMFPNCSMAENGLSVEIDGKQVVYTQQDGIPFVDDAGRTQVPFRKTMQDFGCDVSWNSEKNMVVAQKNGTVVEVPIGQAHIFRNGVQLENDTAALVRDGRTYLPIRAVLESFGAVVHWDGSKGAVVVQEREKNNIQVHFLDVGQGDATLIDDGTFEILIDAGAAHKGASVVRSLSQYVDGDLDVVIATHEDADHIGGLPDVFDSYQVARVIDNGRTKDTQAYEDYQHKVDAEGCTVQVDTQVESIALPSGAVLQILPLSGSYHDANDNSVVTMLDYDDVEMLLLGDLTTKVMDVNLSKFSDVEVLKAGHHGSNTSVNPQFLQAVKPETIIISAGANNPYGHPHAEALAAYLGCGADVYGTFRSGDIVIETDGKNVFVNAKNPLTMADAGAASATVHPETVKQPEQVTQPEQQPVYQTDIYIGNKNSHVFHHSDCTSVQRMNQSNQVILKNKEDALAQGYRPCKLCQP